MDPNVCAKGRHPGEPTRGDDPGKSAGGGPISGRRTLCWEGCLVDAEVDSIGSRASTCMCQWRRYLSDPGF